MKNIARSASVTSKPVFVLDSFALLAYLNGEPGQERIVDLLTQAQAGKCRLLLCTINLGEILYTVERRRGLSKAQQTQALIESLPIEEVPADRSLVLDAAHIKASHPISYADAFATALAARESATVLTGDPEFENVKELVTVEWLTAH
ncbi:MAG: VapC toxin family PIN domain ribonuclease [Chloroflexi bacterium HGW-Chloroflexi-6]|nr:MAG: VapC toxin family PIN domain ribonuclease [Chloroflexi bacterium HGW-Chloroflexi-6]